MADPLDRTIRNAAPPERLTAVKFDKFEPTEFDKKSRRDRLMRGVATVVNVESAESGSNTPDFILGEFVVTCLDAFDVATASRDLWYLGEKLDITLLSKMSERIARLETALATAIGLLTESVPAPTTTVDVETRTSLEADLMVALKEEWR